MSQLRSASSSQHGRFSPPLQTQPSQYSTSTTSPRLVFSWDPYSRDGDSRQQSMMAESDQEDHLVLLPPAESPETVDRSVPTGPDGDDAVVSPTLDAVPGPVVVSDTGVFDDDEMNPCPLPPGSEPGTKTQPPSTMNRRPVSAALPAPATANVTSTRPAAPAVSAPPADSPTSSPAVAPLKLSDVLAPNAAAKSPYISPHLGPRTPGSVQTPGRDGTPTSGRLQKVAEGRPHDPRKYYLDYSPSASQNESLGASGIGISALAAGPYGDNPQLGNSMGGSHRSSRAASAVPGAVTRHSPYGTPRAQGINSGSISPHQTPFSLPNAVTLAPDVARRHELDFATTEELGRVESEPSPFLTLMIPPPPSCRALCLTVVEIRRIFDLCDRWVFFAQAFLRGRRDGEGEAPEPTPKVAAALDRAAPTTETLATALDALPALPILNALRPPPSPAVQGSVWAVVPDPQLNPSPNAAGGPDLSPAEFEADQRALQAWYAEAVTWWKAIHPSTRFDISEWSRSTMAAIERLTRAPRGGNHNNSGPMMRGGGGRGGRYNNNNNNYGYGRGGGGGGGGGGYYSQQQQQQQQQAYYDPYTMADPAAGYGTQWAVMGGESAGLASRAAGGGPGPGFRGQRGGSGADLAYGWGAGAVPGAGQDPGAFAMYGAYDDSAAGLMGRGAAGGGAYMGVQNPNAGLPGGAMGQFGNSRMDLFPNGGNFGGGGGGGAFLC